VLQSGTPAPLRFIPLLHSSPPPALFRDARDDPEGLNKEGKIIATGRKNLWEVTEDFGQIILEARVGIEAEDRTGAIEFIGISTSQIQ
jgi:hypothetical protein